MLQNTISNFMWRGEQGGSLGCTFPRGTVSQEIVSGRQFSEGQFSGANFRGSTISSNPQISYVKEFPVTCRLTQNFSFNLFIQINANLTFCSKQQNCSTKILVSSFFYSTVEWISRLEPYLFLLWNKTISLGSKDYNPNGSISQLSTLRYLEYEVSLKKSIKI